MQGEITSEQEGKHGKIRRPQQGTNSTLMAVARRFWISETTTNVATSMSLSQHNEDQKEIIPVNYLEHKTPNLNSTLDFYLEW